MEIVDNIGPDGADMSIDQIPIIGGFFDRGMRWPHYRERWYAGRIDDVRTFIVENKIRVCGDYMEERHILLDSGERWFFSMRAWGDLMAAVWSTEEDKDFHYIDFYVKE